MLPMPHAAIEEKRYTPNKILALVDSAVEFNLGAEQILSGTGLSPEELLIPGTLTSSRQFLTAVENAFRLGAPSCLSTSTAEKIHLSSYGMYGFAMLCAETLGKANLFAVKYQQLADPALEMRLVFGDDTMSWVYQAYEKRGPVELSEKVYRFLIEFRLVVHATLAKEGVGNWCVPARACFSWPAPSHADQLSKLLQCPLEFGYEENRLDYPIAWKDHPSPLANKITATQLSEQCANLLETFDWQQGFSTRVYHELTQNRGRFPALNDVAKNLCISSRTLHRRLSDEGTSYSKLLAEVRRSLALDYLKSTVLTVDDIAELLSFSDATAFRHAFKQWTGTSPNRYRQEAQGDSSTSNIRPDK